MSVVFNIQRYSLHDGSGIRTTVFFKGCPFTCPWCSNPESLLPTPQLFIRPTLCIKCSSDSPFTCAMDVKECPTNAKEMVGKDYTEQEIMEEILKDEVFYKTSGGGVTFSGGEPLMQKDTIVSLAKQLKQRNIHVAIETTLALNTIDILSLLPYIDEFLVDFKIFDARVAKEVLHLDLEVFKKNVETVLQNGGSIIARIPLIPNYIATNKNLTKILMYLKETSIQEVHLLPFHKLGSSKYYGLQKEYAFDHIDTLLESEKGEFENLFSQAGYIVHMGG